MKQCFSMLPFLALSVAGMVAPNLKASECDKKTNITINQVIEVEGTVLPAGSYVIKLVDLSLERYLVRISNAEENRVIATVFTTPIHRDRDQPAENSEFTLYESGTGRAPALHTWFYPGDQTGFEFSLRNVAPAAEAAQGAGEPASNVSGN